MGERPASRLAAGIAAAMAAAGAVGTLAAGGPYISWSTVEPWVVVWALGLGGLLGVLPFQLRDGLARRVSDHERRWELAVAAWGAIGLAIGAVSVLVLAAGEGSSSAAGALALVALLESGLVVAGVVLLLLAGG